MTAAPHALDTPAFALLDRLVRRMAAEGVDDRTRRAVDLLTTAADPDRAERFAIRPAEAPALVERLTVWALRRVDDAAVTLAADVLDGAAVPNDVCLVA